MPVISMFYGIIVSLYFVDKKRHKQPHIHAKYQDAEVVLSIPAGKVMNPRVKDVRPLSSHRLKITFTNGGNVRLPATAGVRCV